jgi:hypothetical protein
MNTNTNQAATTKPARRTRAEVKNARMEREQRLADKAKARLAKLEAAAKVAKEKAEKAAERRTAIEQNVPVKREKVEVPTIPTATVNKLQKQLADTVNKLGQEHGLDFSAVTPKLTRQGTGFAVHLSATVHTAVKAAIGATREATRFLANHRLIGLKPNLLGKEVQLAGENGSFTVEGLKGRTNTVVLKKVGSDEIKTVPADQFKAAMVMA